MKSCAALLVECLENEGVERVYGVPGEEVLDVLEAMSRSSIEFVSTRHEQGAAFMADSHGRLTGRAGVCLATLGPGATNLITGVADANLDHAPLVAITGQTRLENMRQESHQFVDLVSLFRPVTKWQARVIEPDSVVEIIREAFRTAQLSKPGATYIELPEDVATKPTSAWPIRVRPLPEPVPSRYSLEQAADLIAKSQRPIVMAGNGVARQRAAPALRSFVHAAQLPVIETFMGKGDMDCRDPFWLSIIGLQALDGTLCGLEDADLVICVGYDPVEFAPAKWNRSSARTIVHVDTAPALVDRYYQPAVEVVGDLEYALGELSQIVSRRAPSSIVTTLRQVVTDLSRDGQSDNAYPVKPQRAIADLRAALAPCDVVTTDVGAHKLWIARTFPTYEPNTVLISNGLAAMGFALPAAIAAKLARPDQKVVAVCGDGGFMMNSQELETARRLQTPIVVMIWVDGSYSLIGWKQMDRFGHEYGVRFGNPDFRRYAESYHLPGFWIERTEDLLPTLNKALSLDEPSIVAVPIDYRENAKLVARLGPVECAV